MPRTTQLTLSLVSRPGTIAALARTLADAGVVQGTRTGRERIWAIETRRLEKARRCLDDISLQWDSAIGRLRAFVEER